MHSATKVAKLCINLSNTLRTSRISLRPLRLDQLQHVILLDNNLIVIIKIILQSKRTILNYDFWTSHKKKLLQNIKGVAIFKIVCRCFSLGTKMFTVCFINNLHNILFKLYARIYEYSGTFPFTPSKNDFINFKSASKSSDR